MSITRNSISYLLFRVRSLGGADGADSYLARYHTNGIRRAPLYSIRGSRGPPTGFSSEKRHLPDRFETKRPPHRRAARTTARLWPLAPAPRGGPCTLQHGSDCRSPRHAIGASRLRRLACTADRRLRRSLRRSCQRTARIAYWGVGTQLQPLDKTPLQLIRPIYLELSTGQSIINREVAHPHPRHDSQRRSHFEHRLLAGINRAEVHASLVIHEPPAPGTARLVGEGELHD